MLIIVLMALRYYAAQRFSTHNPDLANPKLTDAQHVIAREHGFDSWPKLVRHLEAMRITLDRQNDAIYVESVMSKPQVQIHI